MQFDKEKHHSSNLVWICRAAIFAANLATKMADYNSDVARTDIPLDHPNMTTEKATFGAGCFWGVEETFRNLKGVTSTAVGYAGGKKENPTYEDVCMNETGHAEVVEVEFDPSQISYDKLLDFFWSNHNPTTMNRQGPDVGTQYRSVIFYHSPEQKTEAEASKAKMDKSGRFPRP